MKIESKQGDVIVLKPDVLQDERGWFTETYKQSEFTRLTGVTYPFVQDNHSRSKAGVIRGLHFQPGMGKLMRVTAGEALLVAVNLKTGEPTEAVLAVPNGMMVWAPDYYARGFRALVDGTEVQYKCTAEYDPKMEGAIHYSAHPGLTFCTGKPPIVSPKDQSAPIWKQVI